MNSVKVEIYGSEYRIRGDADPEYIQEIAHYVDSKMNEVTKETSLGSSLKVAILAALNIAGELFRERDDRNRLLAQVQERAEELSQTLDDELNE
ncbi:MAG: cell division protein ZapA [Candidatus Eisenbacteria bacterium]|nr:cell division protein ZapA [Candidatus Eisenbacteria bacterium]